MLSPLGFALSVSSCIPGTVVLAPRFEAPGGPPTPLAATWTTHDPDDLIRVTSAPEADARGMVRVVLRGAAGWKALGLGGTVLTGGSVCVEPGPLAVDLWKETASGIPICVGTNEVDLGAYGGHRLTVDWLRG